MKLHRHIALLVLIAISSTAWGQTVTGTITDAATGETLIGATILDKGTGKGTVSNAFGRYSLTLKGIDTAHLRISYIGYAPLEQDVDISHGITLDVKLEPSVTLGEVTVTAERVGTPRISQMSAVQVPVEQIKLVPVLFGEADVLKAIQLLPGVQSGTEGMSGIYVRGGGPDENLFLLDGVPLYNVNHLGGFFSAFNGDAVKNITLYKGSFPAHFSGRISSVLDITTNNGNDRELHGNASLGLLSAKVNVEGPIIKEKTTFSLSLRRTYGDLLLKPLVATMASMDNGTTDANFGYYFYDLNAKVTHKFSERSRLYAGLYMGDDAVYLKAKINEGGFGGYSYRSYLKLGYNWGNMAAWLRWNYVINPRLFVNVTGSFTRYRNDLSFELDDQSYDSGTFNEQSLEATYKSGIADLALRADFDYTPSSEHAIKFGGALTHHRFTPSTTGVRNYYSDNDTTIRIDTIVGKSRVRAQEMTLYFEDDWNVTDALKVNAGAAVAGFLVEGRFYPSIQPRLSSRLLLTDDLSVKSGYSYMTQYMHLLSSSNISLPTDLWVPVTARIAPMNSHQVATGVFYTWKKYDVDLSVEGYYKWMNNLMEYRDGSTYFSNSSNWEDKVCLGRGWAYGIEFLAQKTIGKLTGWLGYTWSRTMRQFDELNEGESFPAKYDRIHDISITLQYRPNSNFDCGLTWVFSTGNTATLATQEFEYQNYDIDDYYGYYDNAYGYVESRNNYRLPAYHRMDLSVNFHKQKKHGIRTWSISIYNLYNRQNPFVIYKTYAKGYRAPDGTLYASALVQRSLFPILPSVAYIYKF